MVRVLDLESDPNDKVFAVLTHLKKMTEKSIKNYTVRFLMTAHLIVS